MPEKDKIRLRDINFCTGLNSHRSEILEFLVDLLDLSVRRRKRRTAFSVNEKEIFTTLVGIGFALWRAVFLAKAERSPKGIVENAERVLKRLVEDNSFAYQQEKDFKAWMWGFHVNDAAFRIAFLKSRFSAKSLKKEPVLVKFETRPVLNNKRVNKWERWDGALEAANGAFRLLKSGVGYTAHY